ncbi:cupin domain-containing protein [Vibrio pectenicida]|uniref:cupin domain-containing protein n=1 Tax=Vibrio pectenicida TaxID=62763 RepID=UPI003B9A88E7
MVLTQVDRLVKKLDLKPHPEGGYFSEYYRSKEVLKCPPDRFSGEHVFKTSIYYLLQQGNVSMFHRLKQDELWHHYTGSSVVIHILDPEYGYQQRILGCILEENQADYQILVPQNVWFAAEVKDKSHFSLVGCTTAPGFDFSDWELANVEHLAREFPEQEELISRIMVST